MIKTGVDIVSVERIKKAYLKHKDRFAKKILTEKEISLFEKKGDIYSFLSGRFAAKEAIYKAYGEKNLTWQQVEILNDKDGSPIVTIHGKNVNISLSISHEKEFAIAFAIKY